MEKLTVSALEKLVNLLTQEEKIALIKNIGKEFYVVTIFILLTIKNVC